MAMIGPRVAPPAQYACADGEATQLPTPYRPGYRGAGVVEYLPVRADLGPTLRVERAAGDERRVVGAGLADRPHRRVGAAQLLPDVPVEHHRDRPLASSEVGVLAAARQLVEPRRSTPRGWGGSRRTSCKPPVTARVVRPAGLDVVGQLIEGLTSDDMAVVATGRDDQPSVLVARRVLSLAALVPYLDEHEVGVAFSPSHEKKT